MIEQELHADETTHCAAHPSVETNLRCGKCGKPICPRCLVYTPVGTRCRDCAHLRRLPIYTVTPRPYATAAGAGLAGALAVGAVWGVLMSFFAGLIGILLAAGAGYTIGEIVSTAANRKRSRSLQITAGVSSFLAYLVSQTVPILVGTVLGRFPAMPLRGDLVGAVALSATFGALTNPFTFLAVALAVFLAASRLR